MFIGTTPVPDIIQVTTYADMIHTHKNTILHANHTDYEKRAYSGL